MSNLTPLNVLSEGQLQSNLISTTALHSLTTDDKGFTPVSI